MLCRSTRCIVSSLFRSRVLTIQTDNIYWRDMSVQSEVSLQQNATDSQKTQKRQLNDENDEVAVKAQKVEEETVKEVRKIKRKNHVIMLGYLGKDYFGMQKNPGVKTVETDLLTALLKCDFITKEQFDDIREINFQRAARTDKGVSAIRQIVSLKLPINVNKEEINKHLPKEVRVFSIKRVTNGFNSKSRCSGRTYRYVIPTFALAPEDQKSLPATENEEVDEEERLKQLSVIDGKPYNEFRLTPEMLDRLNETLKFFEGTHNFHNFTSKLRPLDPKARRYIVYFRCIERFVANNIEFAVLEVRGQSFMLHQIRKMMSLIVGISRNIITNDIFKDAFSVEHIDIPIAPGLGLSLHHVHYQFYNEKFGNDGIHETLDWEECEKETEQFYREYILKHIINTEASEQTTLKWLASSLTPLRFAFRARSTSCE